MKKPYRQRRGKEQADNEKKQEKKNVIRSVNKSVPSEDAGWDEEAIEKGSNVWNRRKKKSHDETLKNSETDLWDDAEDPSVNSQVRKPFQNEMPRRETSEQGFTSYNPYWKNYEKSHRETENEWRITDIQKSTEMPLRDAQKPVERLLAEGRINHGMSLKDA